MNKKSNEPVSTALLLAAGTGSRLYPLTRNAPKCLTIVNGKTILERMISSLNRKGFKRLVIVTGHLEHCIRDYLGDQIGKLKIEYIFSPLYKTTNNIYSLWMAREVINESFLLLESDLIFDESLLDDMLFPDSIALAKMQPWMNGTCVTIDQSDNVNAFLSEDSEVSSEDKFKTVNIYSLSMNSWKMIIKKLDKQISSGNVNSYYETIFADMVSDKSLSFKSVPFDSKPWYEIDTLEDLAEAEKVFESPKNKTVPRASFSKESPVYKKLFSPIPTPVRTMGVLSAAKRI
ncbi:MAG: phosphocholine cytidylyltransferase family protein [Spirochaetaceae bacterium]|nr:phosphocholine cytidylyltransferase family protein [Spirochaetaceae bacterium]